jgi:hypothetical protein
VIVGKKHSCGFRCVPQLVSSADLSDYPRQLSDRRAVGSAQPPMPRHFFQTFSGTVRLRASTPRTEDCRLCGQGGRSRPGDADVCTGHPRDRASTRRMPTS